jgi:hypothetical protein
VNLSVMLAAQPNDCEVHILGVGWVMRLDVFGAAAHPTRRALYFAASQRLRYGGIGSVSNEHRAGLIGPLNHQSPFVVSGW